MTVPIFTGSYPQQIGAATFDISTGWSADAERFEVLTAPDGFIFNFGTRMLTGINTINYFYYIYIRAWNENGFAPWEPLKWINGSSTSLRTLRGLSTEYELMHAAGEPGVILIRRGTNDGGHIFVSDAQTDANAAVYDSSFIGSQIVLNGGTNTEVRASVPGWELVVDTAQPN